MATPVSTVGSERETFDALITRANEYYQQSRWQEQLHVLQEALTVSSKSTFPDSHRYRQEVLLELGGLRRRLGQYDECKRMLHDALNANDDPNAFPAMRVKILGELGTMYMHRGDFSRAQKTFRDQFNFSEGTSIAAETGRCYAIRNQGIAAYNLSQQAQQQYREGLLKEAMQDVETGMKLAQSLHDRLEKEEPGSPNIWYIVRWQVSCIDRLAICYVAAGNHRKAAKLVAKSQTIQDELRRRRGSEESDLRAYSNFFYGKVLYATGQKEEALKAWNPGPGQCSSAIALCKEPSKEHAGYLKELADAGCDFSSYDEQGFSALDYAEMSDIAYKMGMTQTILDSFRRDLRVVFASQEAHLSESQISTMVKAEIQTRRAQAKVRWCYRDILQEKVRPELRKHNTDAIGNLRTIYANSLTMDKWKRRTLDWFRYVEYNEFKRLGRLPIADEDREVTNEWSTRAIVDSHEIGGDQSNVFIVFFSYRWIGASRDPPIEGPDDAYNTQYRRMLQALELLLEEQKEVSPDNVGIWLVSQAAIAAKSSFNYYSE